MPSIKKRVTGFIRQFSAPSGSAAAAANHASAAKEAVKGKSKSCGGGGGGDNTGPCKSPQMDSSKCHPDGFIRRYLNG